ncbi:hypothetical protein DL98DRAFT_539263 [Cadophora sp. DSE1049]|nr:hypothetical protein DL98DRAFT_539263 [Cadophora sp. DSE1049]
MSESGGKVGGRFAKQYRVGTSLVNFMLGKGLGRSLDSVGRAHNICNSTFREEQFLMGSFEDAVLALLNEVTMLYTHGLGNNHARAPSRVSHSLAQPFGDAHHSEESSCQATESSKQANFHPKWTHTSQVLPWVLPLSSDVVALCLNFELSTNPPHFRMSSSNRAGGTTNHTGTTATSASAVQPPIRPRKSKWLQDDGHLIGIARRKGEKNPFNWNVEVDPQYARYAPKGWSPAFPPPAEKKKKKKRASSTNSSASGSGSEKKGGGVLGKLMFWKKKGKGKGKATSSSAGGSGSGTAAGTSSNRRGSSST